MSAAMLRTKPKAVFLISPRLAGCVESPLSVAMVDRALGRGTAPLRRPRSVHPWLAEMDASVSVVRGFSRMIGGLS